MVSFRKKPQSNAEIFFSSSKRDKASFLTNETIIGTAVFNLPNGVDFDHSKIAFRGTVKTSTADIYKGSIQKEWRTEKLDFLAVSLDTKARPGYKSEDGVVKVPFRFNLQECERISTLISELPPSLDSKDEGRRSSDSQYSISYNITASAYSNRDLISSTSKRVSILPVSQDVFEPSNVPGEYFWTDPIDLKVKHSHTKPSSSHIDVAGQEPEPMILVTDDDVSEGNTEIPFVVKLSQQGTNALDMASLPSEVHLKTKLISKTHLTPDGMKQVVSSVDKPRYTGKSDLSIQKSHEQEVTVKISNWEQYSSSPTEPFALAKFSFLFNVDGEKAPLPTFYTPLLSRKYAVEVTVSFANASSHHLKLSLPLDIVAEDYDAHDVALNKKMRSVSVTEARL